MQVAEGRLRGEGGITLVELMVASAAMLVLVGAFITTFYTITSSETNTVASENAADAVRIGMVQLQHDIQSANPVVALPSVSDYGNEVTISVEEPSGPNQQVTWTYDSATHTLYRQAGGSGGSSVPEITGVVNGASTPVFSYFDSAGNNLVAGANTTSAEVAACASRISVQIDVSGGQKTTPYAEHMSVAVPDNLPSATAGAACA